MDFEYGIRRNRTTEIHRTGMSQEEAEVWLIEWVDDGGKPEAFSIISRPLGHWDVSATYADLDVCRTALPDGFVLEELS